MKRIATAALAASLLLALGACSSDSDGASDKTTTTTAAASGEGTTDGAVTEPTILEGDAAAEVETPAVDETVEVSEDATVEEPAADQPPAQRTYLCDSTVGGTCGFLVDNRDGEEVYLSLSAEADGTYLVTLNNQSGASFNLTGMKVEVVDAEGTVIVPTPASVTEWADGQTAGPETVTKVPVATDGADLEGATFEVTIDWIPVAAFAA